MQFKAKVAVCSEISTKYINANVISTQNFLILNMVVRKVTARLYKVQHRRNLTSALPYTSEY